MRTPTAQLLPHSTDVRRTGQADGTTALCVRNKSRIATRNKQDALFLYCIVMCRRAHHKRQHAGALVVDRLEGGRYQFCAGWAMYQCRATHVVFLWQSDGDFCHSLCVTHTTSPAADLQAGSICSQNPTCHYCLCADHTTFHISLLSQVQRLINVLTHVQCLELCNPRWTLLAGTRVDPSSHICSKQSCRRCRTS